MASNRVTLRQIAEYVGVHPSTVSRVLNPDTRSRISVKVAKRVEQAVALFGYSPNRAAHSLRTNRSSTIGIVVSDISSPSFQTIIQGIQEVLIRDGYSPVICSSDQHRERKRRIIEVMRNRQFDGVILLTRERSDPLVSACRHDGIPIVQLDRGENPAVVPAIHLDDRVGVTRVMDHLTSLGHTKIGVISGPQRFSGAFTRHRAILREMSQRGLPIDRARITSASSYSYAEGLRCGRKLLGSRREFTAVVTGSDILAIGLIRALKERGLACPSDVSVVGYNDIGVSDRTDPPLTTVHFDDYDPGVALAQLLLNQLNGRETPIAYKRIEPTLLVRGSTGPPRQPPSRADTGAAPQGGEYTIN